MILAKQVVIIVVVLAGSAYSGWHGRGLHEDSKALAVLQAEVTQSNEQLARESAIAKVVSEKLDGLIASETIIDRGIIREVEKPVYRNVCFGADLVGLLNQAAAGGNADTADINGPLSNRASAAD